MPIFHRMLSLFDLPDHAFFIKFIFNEVRSPLDAGDPVDWAFSESWIYMISVHWAYISLFSAAISATGRDLRSASIHFLPILFISCDSGKFSWQGGVSGVNNGVEVNNSGVNLRRRPFSECCCV